MERNSRTFIVLETLRTIATILLFAPLSTATPFPNISTNFSPRNSRVYKRRIKRRRNFLFTKSKRARAVFEFSIRALAFLFLIDGTHTFSRSRGRASNDRIFLLSIFQHSSWMDRVHYLPPILPSSSHGSCHVAMHRRVRRMILLPSRDHGTSRARRARSVLSLSLFFFPLDLDSRFSSYLHDGGRDPLDAAFSGVSRWQRGSKAWQESRGRNLFSLSSKSSRTLAGDARAKPPRVMLGSDWSLRRGASVATTRAKAESPPPPRPAPPCPPPWSATGW